MTELEINHLATRIRDIKAIVFKGTLEEISATLGLILTLYEMDDHPLVIGACKSKMQEGVVKLEQLAAKALATAQTYSTVG